MDTITVRTATSSEQARVISTLTLAFVRDPVTRWVWPDPHQYLTHYPEFVSTFGGQAFEHDAAYCADDFSGGGLWLPPEVQPDEETLVGLIQRSVSPERLPTAFALLEQMGSYHPEQPHWYLSIIGVDPSRHGRGHGATLLRHALERVDREGRIAYLESSNPANVPLYQRHGFEVVGTIQAGDAPPMFPMVRQARRALPYRPRTV